MPYYHDKLLSAWGNDRIFEVGKPPSTVDPAILKHMRPNPAGIGHIAPNPRKCWPNQVNDIKVAGANGTSNTAPKLLSEKAREPSSGRRISDATKAVANLVLSNNIKADVPSYYGMPNIKIGRYGVEDFDFK